MPSLQMGAALVAQLVILMGFALSRGTTTSTTSTTPLEGMSMEQYLNITSVWTSLFTMRFPEELFPLFLTPLIEAGHIEYARKRSRVHLGDVESYSGYFTVNKEYSSNMFFWFFPAESKRSEAPVLLWLNGGPGRTSLVGALLENGPYQITMDSTVERRPFAWTKHFSMIYVDNPVGVGYSYTKDDNGYSMSMEDVSVNLYSVLTQFFKLFPQYSKNDFYVGGQSYAGKYVPSLAYYIVQRNEASPPPEVPMNFKGIYVGAGYCDPEHMMPAYADFLYNAGFASDAYRLHLQRQYNELFTNARSKKTGSSLRFKMYLHVFFNRPMNDLNLDSADHLLGANYTNTKYMRSLDKFMKSTAVRMALHVGFPQTASKYLWSSKVADKLSDEFLTNTSMQNAFLMDRYKVLHYSGNLDIVVNVPMTEAFLKHVQWSGRDKYLCSHRNVWSVDSKLAGWFVKIGQFTRVVVHNSGHMVPYDQPEAALDMIKRFIFDESFGEQPDDPCQMPQNY